MTKKTEQNTGSLSSAESDYAIDAEYIPIDHASEIGITSPSEISESLEVTLEEIALDVQILKARFQVFLENYAYKEDISERFDKMEALMKRHFGDY